MAYTKQTWQNEVLSGVSADQALFTIKNSSGTIINDDVIIELKSTEVQAGSEFTADRMNHIEDGIEANSAAFDASTGHDHDGTDSKKIAASNVDGLADYFDASTGHDHDGTNSKKIAASNVDGLADYFDASTGHDHDGTDSKKIAYANVTGTPEFETSAANIKPNGATSSVGSATTIARADHIHMGFPLVNNAGAHNSIWRGISLGTSVTTAQWTAISNGTFEDMYIGDYWTIGDVVWRIAAFNYFYNCGDTAFTSNHVTIVPDSSLASSKMNDTNTTDGGYYGSGIRASGSGLATATTIINSAFSGHVATHRQFLTNAVTNGKPSGASWYDCSVELMSEIMVYGCGIFKPVSDGTSIIVDYTISKSQLPLFALNPKLIISSRYDWWLRDVVSAASFARVYNGGHANTGTASASLGVRPAFSII